MFSDTGSRPSIPLYEVTRSTIQLAARDALSLGGGLLRRFEVWAALAVVLATSAGVWYLAQWMLERWQWS